MGREAQCHAELGDQAGEVHAWLEVGIMHQRLTRTRE